MKNGILFLLVFSTFAFAQQKKKSAVVEVTTEKFTPGIYQKIAPVESSIYDKTYIIGKKKIRITEDKQTIHVVETPIGSQYATHKVYNAKSKLLKAVGYAFSNFGIGIDKEYDAKGRLIRKRNLDADYRFSLDQLIAKLKLLGIDITKNPELHFVNRYSEKGRPPAYTIMIRKEPDAMKVRLMEINADTGAIISDRITFMEE